MFYVCLDSSVAQHNGAVGKKSSKDHGICLPFRLGTQLIEVLLRTWESLQHSLSEMGLILLTSLK